MSIPIPESKPVTTDADGDKTLTPQPKVVAAAAGAAVGGALGAIGVYVVETTLSIDIPGPVEAAVAIVLTAVLSFLSGYFKRPSSIN